MLLCQHAMPVEPICYMSDHVDAESGQEPIFKVIHTSAITNVSLTTPRDYHTDVSQDCTY